ncbi:MmcQ/YjbR family DNA-binding protein [Listeria sp. FSL L7-1509]|uniref:MmcQ/YjbR family DNA-binding protein n=1 Tax=Listeria immobilis TaxID=2713502 RepID=A0ABR6SXN2_9LIST|nr:MmcQ/YjbR family DNA-binding protein [Listeria immobilis]MBC1483849.1 MmcQ/YjbR family DNA-binding protein [Listeria immobilis]MBC1507571.1 MmcQ/YjbR family DNA-binding protein [Listeria immobilis]MBC1510436.1 MmcQ/YjbR family DNA-binding protein [Listeria immobilis]MBC6303527.1 MmcQ/YjbR family DNA-binding protein [Listeria immobilis]MBC6312863.1 MmcQ/YjbR family DNA-binding protein [Listeria immobilis]
MNYQQMLEEKVAICLTLQGAKETFPFDKKMHALTLGGKIFALIHMYHGDLYVSLKCQPERIDQLRDEYNSIKPGYHLNKKHWITLVINEQYDVEAEIEFALIQNSYQLIFQKLPKKAQNTVRFSTND